MSGALAVRERTRLASCETRIERGLATFVEVGEALLEVRDGRLYRAEHGTFEGYCRDRWGLSRPRAYQLIEAAEVSSAVSTNVDTPAPSSEAVARELAPLRSDPPRLREAWSQAVEEHGPAPTAAQVREKVRPADPEPSGFDRWSEKTTADIERRHALTTHFWPAMRAVYRILSSREPALEELRRQDRKTAAGIADDCAHAIDLFTELRDEARRQANTLEAVK